MMDCSESQPEAAVLTTLLKTKKTTSIGAWNIRSLYETGKTVQVAREMRRYGLDILGLSETRWLQSGQLRLSSGELLLYSGHEDDTAIHSQGVALMLSRKAHGALLGWQPHGPRIITATFRINKKIECCIAQCYAPTNNAEEEEKNEFYEQLQGVVNKWKDSNINIIMGDFNAKIGQDNTGYEEVMGKLGLGEMNENGVRFADLCANNELVIGGSIFQHKDIHKATWVSPDHRTENQIDHFCICKKFRRSLEDVRVKRGADAATDHHLLVARAKLKLKRHKNATDSGRKKFNTSLLRNEDTRQQYHFALSNRFQVLSELWEEDTDLHTQWQQAKEALVTTCEEVMGRQKHQQKEWISANTLQKIEDRRGKKEEVNRNRTRAGKAKAQEEYSKANGEVKKSAKQDKREYIDKLAEEAEGAARSGNMRLLYETTRKLSGRPRRPECPVKDNNGEPIMDREGQSNRWVEHFENLLNRAAPDNPPEIPAAIEDLPINCNPPTREEIRRAIQMQKNGKAAGPDEICPEALKADIETTVGMLYPLFTKIWEEEDVPRDWKEGHLVKIPKKGDLGRCENYRGIMLLSVPGKIFNRILLERMKETVDTLLREQQAGFRSNRSCADQIATLRIILEQSQEWNSSLYCTFVDYEKAFDSVHRDTLWQLMRRQGIPTKFVNIIRNSYEGMSCKVVHEGQLTKSFPVKTGVRQGCLLSPFLFLLVVDWIMETTTMGKRNGIQWTMTGQLDDLDFADDIVLLSHTHQQMQDKTSDLAEISAQVGLRVNRGKTKVLRANTKKHDPINLNEEPLEEVEKFSYLGSNVDGQGGTDTDIKARIGKARIAFRQLKSIWTSKLVGRQTKVRLFNSNVKSVLMYGAETWRTTKTISKKIQTFINGCLRQILGIHWPETISNEDLWEQTNQLSAEKEIKKRKWRWIGHTLRKPIDSITRHALRWNPQGQRRRGRPRNSWRRDLEAETKRAGYTWKELEREAQDRVRWRVVVDGLCSSGS